MNLDTYLAAVSDAYDALPHEPTSELVALCYRELKTELWWQYQLLSAFVRVSFTAVDPYGGSREMFDSVEHGSLAVYTVADLPAGHPFAEATPNGQLYNTVFRAVHDGLAHFPERNSFGKVGEFKAYLAHRRMLVSPLARWALATETIAQNAWFHMHSRTFAPQKATLLPLTLVSESTRVSL
jgi:hypothetical protein